MNFARLCQIYSEYEKYAKLCQKLFWQNRPKNFLPKASKFCQILKIWQKLCQIGNAGLNIAKTQVFINCVTHFHWLILSCDKALRGAVCSSRWWSCVQRVITLNPKIEVTHQRVSFRSGILLIISYGILLQMISVMLWITLFLGVTCDYTWSISIQ